jgi:DNA-directed RNA polymerases I and III subunit RPAC2
MSVNEVKNPHAKTIFQVIDSGQTFCLGDEDHTLANALRHVLIEDSSNTNVEFAGYSVPHPSEPMVQIRVQTMSSTTTTNQQQSKHASGKSLQSACVTLFDQCQHVLDSWEELLPETKEDRLKNEARLLEEAREEEEEEEEAMEEDE